MVTNISILAKLNWWLKNSNLGGGEKIGKKYTLFLFENVLSRKFKVLRIVAISLHYG